MSQEIFFLKTEWLLNASFFPEQLKPCVHGLPVLGRQAGLAFLLRLAPGRTALVNLAAQAVTRQAGETPPRRE